MSDEAHQDLIERGLVYEQAMLIAGWLCDELFDTLKTDCFISDAEKEMAEIFTDATWRLWSAGRRGLEEINRGLKGVRE